MKTIKTSGISSIRITPDVKDKLIEESDEKKVSLSFLVNQILSDYVNWTEKTEQHRAILVLRPFYKAILDSLDRDKVIELSRTVAKDDLAKFLRFAYGDVTFNILINELAQYLSKIDLKFKGSFVGIEYNIMITHDLGKNWPYFITNIYDALFSELGYCVIEEKYYNDYFTFKITKISDIKN